MTSQQIRVSATRFIILQFLPIVLAIFESHAQISEYSFKSLTVDDGLSQNSVYATLHDRRGFMWFGTKDGLNRYDGYNFVIYKHNPADSTSLVNNNVNVLYEDRASRMWVATGTGLHLYDPQKDHFRRIPLLAPPPLQQTPVSILAITEDKAGKLWLATTSTGLIQLVVPEDDSQTEHISITYFLHDPNYPRSLYRNHVPTVYCDSRGTLWVGTEGRLQSMDPFSPESGFDTHPFRENSDEPDPNVICVYEDSKSSLWLGTLAGLGRCDRTSNRITIFPWQGNDFVIQDKSVRTICEDERGKLWLGTFGRLVYFDTSTEQYRAVPRHVEETFDLFRAGTVQIKRDRSSALWFGSNGYGVFRHNAILSRFQSFTRATVGNIGWPGHSVRSIFEDSENNIWIGSYGGLYIVNPSRMKFSRVAAFWDQLIIAMAQDSHGKIWMATHGLVQLDPKTKRMKRYLFDPQDSTSIRSNGVSGVMLDHKGELWVVAYGALSKHDVSTDRFTHFPFETELELIPDDNPVAVGMYQDHFQRIWLATEKGVYMFDETMASFKRYLSEPGNEHSLSYSVARCVTPDPLEPERILWIGTAGGGLNRFDMVTEQFTAFTEADGLPNNVVYGILGDSTGNLWLSTNRGLTRFNPRTRTFQNYTSQDDLQSNEFNSGAYFKNRRGEMFFGGINGFDVFNPHAVYANSVIPEVVITELLLFNKPVTLHDSRVRLTDAISEASSVTLSYAQNVFSLTFASLEYTAPEKNLYQFMLEGFQEEFVPPTTTRTATYTNLDPGTYTFRVRGSNSDGIWSEKEASLAITVLPPFWMTWWFRAVALMSLLATVGSAVRYFELRKIKEQMWKMEQETALERERLRISRDMHDDLGARLTEIRLMSEMAHNDANAEQAMHVLRNVSETAQDIIATFGEIVWSVNPQNDTVENLAAYISQYAVDYLDKARIRCRLDLPETFPAMTVSSEIRHHVLLAAKEALNNAVKYAETSEVHVSVRIENALLSITIMDFGKGFDIENTRAFGNGLPNMKKRLEQAGGRCTVSSQLGAGTTVMLEIPLLVKGS